MSLLEVDGLRVGYGFPVLMGVSFAIEEGETAVMFGLNGAGKTTTVATVAGLLRPEAGTIRFDGVDITKASAAERVAMGIALVPEGRRVFPELSVANNLRLGAWTKRRHHKEIEESRQLCFSYFPRLAERSEQMAGTLSGGEQQMLAIARALVTRPAVLLVDEMSAGLAPVVTESLIAGLQQVNERGASLLLVEQSPRLIAHMVDRLYLLEQGRIVRSGTVDEVGGADAIAELYLGVK